jgi:hypothetical protein
VMGSVVGTSLDRLSACVILTIVAMLIWAGPYGVKILPERSGWEKGIPMILLLAAALIGLSSYV